MNLGKCEKKSNSGFTLAELLVVVALIAILVALSIPIFTSSQKDAKATVCQANRRALLAEIVETALTEDKTPGEVFEDLYLAKKADYPCPEDGTFSWSVGHIECGRHGGAGGAGAAGMKVGGYTNVILDSGIDQTVRESGDKITITKGQIYKIGDKYYIGQDNYSERTISLSTGQTYEKWLKDTWYVKEVDFSKEYSQEKLNPDGTLKDYSANGAQTGVGSVYKFDGKLYVQKSSFTGNLQTQSSDPTQNTAYWTLLGTIQS